MSRPRARSTTAKLLVSDSWSVNVERTYQSSWYIPASFPGVIWDPLSRAFGRVSWYVFFFDDVGWRRIIMGKSCNVLRFFLARSSSYLFKAIPYIKFIFTSIREGIKFKPNDALYQSQSNTISLLLSVSWGLVGRGEVEPLNHLLPNHPPLKKTLESTALRRKKGLFTSSTTPQVDLGSKSSDRSIRQVVRKRRHKNET